MTDDRRHITRSEQSTARLHVALRGLEHGPSAAVDDIGHRNAAEVVARGATMAQRVRHVIAAELERSTRRFEVATEAVRVKGRVKKTAQMPEREREAWSNENSRRGATHERNDTSPAAEC